MEEGFTYGVVRQLLDGVVRDRSRVNDSFSPAPQAWPSPFSTWSTPRDIVVRMRPSILLSRCLTACIGWLSPLRGATDADLGRRPALGDGAARPWPTWPGGWKGCGWPSSLLPGRRNGPVLADLEAAGPAVQGIRPPLLTPEAVGTLVRARLDRSPTPAFVAACHASTGGNPFLVGELLGGLGAEGVGATDDEVAAVRDLGPNTVANAVLVRLAQLPAGTTQMARSLAVLGETAGMRHLAELAARPVCGYSRSRRPGPQRHCDRRSAGALVHPIVRRAIYEELTPSERALRHRRAAELLSSDGAPSDAVAAHLLLAVGRPTPKPSSSSVPPHRPPWRG